MCSDMLRTPRIMTSDGNLSRCLGEMQEFPLLSAEEKLDLGRRWRNRRDLDAAHKLVTSHLRLVADIAMGYRCYGLTAGELIGEANIGGGAGSTRTVDFVLQPMPSGGSELRTGITSCVHTPS